MFTDREYKSVLDWAFTIWRINFCKSINTNCIGRDIIFPCFYNIKKRAIGVDSFFPLNPLDFQEVRSCHFFYNWKDMY